jgi:para-aminobenzoate synthetase component 1
MAIERHPTVLQMVSTIEGRLGERFDGLDLVRACFPGGSMTGAPKIEAMKVIRRLEPIRRGIYSGAIGYLDYRGGLDLNIVIRSIIVENGRARIQVGGAVVADSDERLEYKETIDKAKALLAALEDETCER